VSTAARFAGFGFINFKRSAILLGSIQTADGGLRFFVAAHLNETETFAPAAVAVFDHLSTNNGPELREQLLQIRAPHVVTQIPAIQLLSHHPSPSAREHDMLFAIRAKSQGACAAA
jgi:hypothetical protein